MAGRRRPIRVLFVFGTRPEAIKLSPVIRHFRNRPADFEVRVCVTAQHRQLLDQVLSVFEIAPDYDLDIMEPCQSLLRSASTIMAALESVLEREKADVLLVQGDTTSTFCGALAGFYARIMVGHVEAGLRTGDRWRPFPEEMNRVLTARLSNIHFAPTSRAATNLIAEGVPSTAVFVTGNPGIDALHYVRERLRLNQVSSPEWPWLDAKKKLILVTAHRRESFGSDLAGICAALIRLASRSDVQIVYPVHPNPNVRNLVRQKLASSRNIHLIEPLEYVSFVDLMCRSYLILTDSGGIQEEAPSLGKPVLVMREATERQEAVEGGTSVLVGTKEGEIVTKTSALLDDPDRCRSVTQVQNPYGDGHASERIAAALLSSSR